MTYTHLNVTDRNEILSLDATNATFTPYQKAVRQHAEMLAARAAAAAHAVAGGLFHVSTESQVGDMIRWRGGAELVVTEIVISASKSPNPDVHAVRAELATFDEAWPEFFRTDWELVELGELDEATAQHRLLTAIWGE